MTWLEYLIKIIWLVLVWRNTGKIIHSVHFEMNKNVIKGQYVESGKFRSICRKIRNYYYES